MNAAAPAANAISRPCAGALSQKPEWPIVIREVGAAIAIHQDFLVVILRSGGAGAGEDLCGKSKEGGHKLLIAACAG